MKTRIITLLAGILLTFALVIGLPMLFTDVDAAAASSITINGVTVANGKYLAEGATSTVSSKPSGGYAYYNGTGTLTLYNFDLSTSGSSYLIYSTGDLILDLQGTNTLSNNATFYNVIYVKNADLTISGSGKLTVTQKATNYAAINAKNLTINGGTLVVNCVNNCLRAQESVGIYKGSVTLNTTDDYYALSCGSFFDMTGGNLNITTAGYGICAGDYTNISGGNIKITSRSTAIMAKDGPVTVKSCKLDIKTTDDATGIYAPGQTVTFQGGAYVKIDAGFCGVNAETLYVKDLKDPILITSSTRALDVTNVSCSGSGFAGSFSENINGSSPKPLDGYNLKDVKYAYFRPCEVIVGGVPMAIGDYLAQGATAASTCRPSSGGYARLSVNGESDELELHNFSISATGTTDGIYTTSSLKLSVYGNNTINTVKGSGIHLAVKSGGGLYVIGGGGTLNINSTGWYGIFLLNGDASSSSSSAMYYQMGDAVVKINARGGPAISTTKNDVKITAGELYASSQYNAINCVNLIVTGGKLDAVSTSTSTSLNCAVFVTGSITHSPLQVRASTAVNEALGTYTTANQRTYKRVVIASHICVGQKVAAVSPTCTATGKREYYRCSCLEKYEDVACTIPIENINTWGIVPASGHSPISGWVTDGQYHWKTCTKCSISVIPNTKVSHFGGESTCRYKAQCDACQVFYGDFADHDWSSSWDVTNANGHSHSCQTPGCEASDTFISHTPGAPATESTAQTCTVCHYVIAPKLNHVHKTTEVKAKNATCGTSGNTAYYICDGCSKWFSDAAATREITDKSSVNVPALQHDYAPATCTAPKTCKRSGCGATEGTPLGHLPAENYSSDATHHYKTCTRCDIAAIPETKVAHSGGNATCLDKAVCDVCSAAYGDKADHKWSDTWDFYDQEEGHCHFCTTPGCTASSEWEAHVPGPEPTEDSDQVCTECGCVLVAALNHVHDYTAGIQHSENEHWNSCSCGDKANVEAHSDTDGDGLCDKCAFTLPVTDTGSSDTTGNTPGNTVENTSGDSTDAVTTDENGDKNGKDNTLTVILSIIGAVAVTGIVIAVVIANKKKKS